MRPANTILKIQITSDEHQHERPVISDDGTIAWFQDSTGGGLGYTIMRLNPGSGAATIVEFSSRNVNTNFNCQYIRLYFTIVPYGCQTIFQERAAGRTFGINSDGQIISFYTFYEYDQAPYRRFNLAGIGRLPTDYAPVNFYSYESPDINTSSVLVFSDGFPSLQKNVYISTATSPFPQNFIDEGQFPHVSDGASPEVVYLKGNVNVTHWRGAGQQQPSGWVDLGLWSDIAGTGANAMIVYECFVNGFSQICKATPTSTGTIEVTTNIDTASFEIAGLEGGVTFTGTGKSFSASSAPAGAYTITYGPATGYSAPPAETKILTSGGTVAFSADYRPWLQSLEFQVISSWLDGNPNAGGGLRIFPDKQFGGDIVNRRKVRVVAKLSAAVSNIAVHFRSFDIDDPSDSLVIDPNGPAGDDNLETTLPRNGTLSFSSAETDGTGTASVEFEVTMQPGDNFRLAASLDPIYLMTVSVGGTSLSDAAGIVLATRAAGPTDRAIATELLTVWRRVHIEVDSMASVRANGESGQIASIQRVRSPVPGTSDMWTKIRSRRAIPEADQNRFENGRLMVGGFGSFSVALTEACSPPGNSAVNPFSCSVITIRENPPRLAAGMNFMLYDDDDFNDNDGSAGLKGDAGEAPTEPDLSLLQDSDAATSNIFAPAYIRPTYDLPNPNSRPGFVLNTLDWTGSYLRRLFAFDNRAAKSSDYWVIYLLGAYQPMRKEDQDPYNEPLNTGRADEVTDSANGVIGSGAVIFLESLSLHELTMQDAKIDRLPRCQANAAVWKQTFRNDKTTAHEVGHLFGGTHYDDGLMTGDCTMATLSFGDITLGTIRGTKIP